MICPECETLNDEKSEFCINCGAKLPVKEKKKLFKSRKADKSNSGKNTDKKPVSKKLIRIIIIAAAVLVMAITILVIVLSGMSTKGFKTAQKLSTVIGQDIIATAKIAPLEENSVSAALNQIAASDYYYESDDIIDVDGVKVPEWSVGVYLVKTKINKVTYRDYTLQDKSYKGVKVDGYLEYEKINASMTLTDVEDYLGIKPSLITYYESTVEYTYRYYYVDENKNERAYILTVKFDNEQNYLDKEIIDLSINPNIE